jgi:acyl carrier protein
LSNGTEARLIQIWQDVLGHDELRVDDDFFELGGHSLLATRVISRVNQAFDCNLSLGIFLAHPTVRMLAQKVASAPKGLTPGPIRRRR